MVSSATPVPESELAELAEKADVWTRHIEAVWADELTLDPRIEHGAMGLARGLTKVLAEVERLRSERSRYHAAWHNARERAASAQADVEYVETTSRAAVLDEAADELERVVHQFFGDDCGGCGDCAFCTWGEAIRHLRSTGAAARAAQTGGAS